MRAAKYENLTHNHSMPVPENSPDGTPVQVPRCQTTCRLLYETLGGRKRVDNHDALRQRTEGVGDPQDAGHP